MSRPTRREFLKQTAAGALAAPELFSTVPREEHFFIPIGACTSIENAPVAIGSGCGYIEEGVSRFLMPDRSADEFNRHLERVRGYGMPVLACNSFIPGRLKSTGPEADHDGVLRYAETAFHRANEAGVEIIVFGSSGSRRIPEGFDRQQARHQFVSLLQRMGSLADSTDVTIAIEPLQRGECNFINTVREGRSIVRDVDHPSIRLLADFYHMMRENEGADVFTRDDRDLLVHLHIAEKAERTPPGTAGDDFTSYFRALKDMQYEGLLSIECRWDDIHAQLPQAVRTIRRQLDRVAPS